MKIEDAKPTREETFGCCMKKRRKIILVDDNRATLLTARNMLKNVCEVYPLPSAAKMFELLENVIPDLILLDVNMPEMNGYEAIKRLKKDPRWSAVPVIFLTAQNDDDSELEGLSLGAIDYVSKPFCAPLLLRRIENHLLIASQQRDLKNYSDNLARMVQQKTRQVFTLQNAILGAVSEMVESRDVVTGGHVARTQQYLALMVDEMIREGLYMNETADWNLDFLLPSAQLHDVGKIAISDAILNKPARLTPQEFEEMKRHTTIGVKMIEKIENQIHQDDFLRHAKTFAGTHHEKWNGTGYPMGLKGLDIPLEGRLLAIVDVYDALISLRPYKPPRSPEEAGRIIEEGDGTHFDPALLNIFRRVKPQIADIALQDSPV